MLGKFNLDEEEEFKQDVPNEMFKKRHFSQRNIMRIVCLYDKRKYAVENWYSK